MEIKISRDSSGKKGISENRLTDTTPKITSLDSPIIPAVIYARVSTDEQSKGYSLPTQLEACHKYASDRGYCVMSEYIDDYTGASMDRPGLNNLRDYISQNRVAVIIVYDIDRLARSLSYQLLIEEEFENIGASLEYVMGQYANTDEGRFQKNLKGCISEYEKAKILERSKRGKQGKAKSGYVLVGARPPYGYQVKSEPHKSWLEIDKDEAEIVRLVFRLYLNGDGESEPSSIQNIALRLTKMQIPTRGDKEKLVAKKHGPGVWTGAMVRHILMNETYTGVWHYGKTQMINDGKKYQRKSIAKRGLGKQIARPREEWISVNVPAIINREIYDYACKRRISNSELANRNVKWEYLLGRRLRCAKCGYTYQGHTRRGSNQYYCCHGKEQRPVQLCDMPSFRSDYLDNVVWEWVKNLLQHPDQLAEGLRGTQAELEQGNSSIKERISLIDSRVFSTQEQLTKLLDLYLNGEFTKEILKDRKEKLEGDLTELSQERKELATHLTPINLTDDHIEMIELFCTEVQAGLDHATFEDKRRYFDMLDVRCKLAFENHEKVAYVKCKLCEQRLSVVQTSPSSSTGATGMTR